MRVLLALLLVGLLGTNAALALYAWKIPEYRRMLWHVRGAWMVHAARPVVIIGDSILAPLDPPEGVENLAIGGATVPFTMDNVLMHALALQPRRVIIGLGVNDLRWGASPQEVAERIAGLVEAIAQADPTTEIVVLSVLPLARGTRHQAETDNDEILALNALLAEAARAGTHGFVDHAARFTVGGALDDRLSSDGIHLNAAGLRLLSLLLFRGLAMELA